MKYEALATEIKQNGGHHYAQAWRDKDFAIYEQRGQLNQFIGYEVIKIKKQEANHMFGRDYPARELYPSSEDWGVFGKTVDTLDRAHEVIEVWRRTPVSSTKGRQRKTICRQNHTEVAK